MPITNVINPKALYETIKNQSDFGSVCIYLNRNTTAPGREDGIIDARQRFYEYQNRLSEVEGDRYLEILSLGHSGISLESAMQLVLETQIVDAAVMSYIVEGIRLNGQIFSLILAHGKITDNGMQVLADFLRNDTTLRVLALPRNEISDQGVTWLADALKYNNALDKLVLCNNQIGNVGIRLVAEALRYNHGLLELSLNGNNMVGDDGKNALLAALDVNRTLQSVDILEDGFDEDLDYHAEPRLDRNLRINLRVREQCWAVELARNPVVRVARCGYMFGGASSLFLLHMVRPSVMEVVSRFLGGNALPSNLVQQTLHDIRQAPAQSESAMGMSVWRRGPSAGRQGIPHPFSFFMQEIRLRPLAVPRTMAAASGVTGLAESGAASASMPVELAHVVTAVTPSVPAAPATQQDENHRCCCSVQ